MTTATHPPVATFGGGRVAQCSAVRGALMTAAGRKYDGLPVADRIKTSRENFAGLLVNSIVGDTNRERAISAAASLLWTNRNGSVCIIADATCRTDGEVREHIARALQRGEL